MNVAPPLPMSDEQRAQLEKIARSSSAEHRQVVRARLLLDAGEGVSNKDLAGRHQVSVVTVRAWRARFAAQALEEFAQVARGRGRKASIGQEKVEQIAAAAAGRPAGATHCSTRSAARAFGVSPATVQRIWSGRGLKTHRVATFKVSNDPNFEAKVIDVVGLYLNPPEHAVVLCVDEKTQIQALDRTQPPLPITKGRAGTMTHDHKRNGVTTLFAALDVLAGKVIGSDSARHRHEEYLAFLKRIDKATDKALDVHVIADTYATHKHAQVSAWLDRNPRFHIHYTPTSSSWLNLVERWFRDLTDKAVRRGAFTSVADLQAAIDAYIQANNDAIQANNDAPRPFVWTAAPTRSSPRSAAPESPSTKPKPKSNAVH